MTDLDVSLSVAAQATIDDIVEQTRTAEQCGYNRVWVPESWGRNSVSLMTVLTERTETVGIGSSIINVFSRSPALVGQSAITLQEVSEGRFRLGIGTSGPPVVENWHGLDFDRPLRRTREYVEIVKLVGGGDSVEYDGDLFDLERFHLRSTPPVIQPGIDVAAMGPKAVELAGRFADGWHGYMLTPEGFTERVEHLQRGIELGDRDPDDVRSMLMVTTCALDDGETARGLVAQHIAFYVGSMGPFYRNALESLGYETLADTIVECWENGDRDQAITAVREELLSEIGLAGTPTEVRQQLKTFTSLPDLDAVAISFPRGADHEHIRSTIQAIEPVINDGYVHVE